MDHEKPQDPENNEPDDPENEACSEFGDAVLVDGVSLPEVSPPWTEVSLPEQITAVSTSTTPVCQTKTAKANAKKERKARKEAEEKERKAWEEAEGAGWIVVETQDGIVERRDWQEKEVVLN